MAPGSTAAQTDGCSLAAASCAVLVSSVSTWVGSSEALIPLLLGQGPVLLQFVQLWALLAALVKYQADEQLEKQVHHVFYGTTVCCKVTPAHDLVWRAMFCGNWFLRLCFF